MGPQEIGMALLNLLRPYQQGDQSIRRPVRKYSRVWGNSGSRPILLLEAAIREKAPFAITLDPARVEVKQGTSIDIKVKLKSTLAGVHSRVNGFSSSVPVRPKCKKQTIAPGANEEVTISLKIQTAQNLVTTLSPFRAKRRYRIMLTQKKKIAPTRWLHSRLAPFKCCPSQEEKK